MIAAVRTREGFVHPACAADGETEREQVFAMPCARCGASLTRPHRQRLLRLRQGTLQAGWADVCGAVEELFTAVDRYLAARHRLHLALAGGQVGADRDRDELEWAKQEVVFCHGRLVEARDEVRRVERDAATAEREHLEAAVQRLLPPGAPGKQDGGG